jgi:2,3-bisphosphoglycerate-independent phosphoglycerate mutase
MRYLVVLVDGLADMPLKSLGGKTPLEAATTPTLDKLSTGGRLGMIRTIPRGEPPETLASLFTLLGYPPGPYLTGRGYYEALATGIMPGDNEWCFRLQFITTDDGKLIDTRAGALTDDEGRELLNALEGHLKQSRLRLVPGRGHTHLLMIDGVDFNGLTSVSPFNILDLPLREHLPEGPGHEVLRKIIQEAPAALARHEVNRVRVDLGQNPANGVWIWGGGTNVSIPGFQKTYGINGAMVSYSDLFRGVAVATGLRVVNPGESPFVRDTSGRLPAVQDAGSGTEISELVKLRESTEAGLDSDDFLFVHVAHPDDRSHAGDAQGKVRAIEQFDKFYLKPLYKHFKEMAKLRLTIVPTLMSRVETRQHDDGPVPFLMWGDEISNRHNLTLTESNAAETGLKIDDGTHLIDYIINGM